MKTATIYLTAFVLILAAAVSAAESGAVAKLKTDLRKQQKDAARQLVRMWASNQRGETVIELAAKFVTRDIRLRAMDPEYRSESLLSNLAMSQVKNPRQLVQLIVMEQLKRQGIDVAAENFVAGNYLIRKGSMGTRNPVADQEEQAPQE